MALPIALHNCIAIAIALATLLEERCGRALTSMVLRGSSHSLQNLPKSPGHRHAPAQKIDDG